MIFNDKKSSEKQREKIARIGISIPENLLEEFDNIIIKNGYTTRSEAIRDAIREFMEKHPAGKLSKKEGISLISFIYDHDIRSVTSSLLTIQHSFYKNIITTQHIHLTKHYCLELIIYRGYYSEAHRLADKILALRGVKLVKIVEF